MIPKREIATHNGQTYFVTSNTAERRPFFRYERWSRLFIEILYGYRPQGYLLHAFVLMPDHFHLIITPAASLELATQCLKGGFSFRAKREFKWNDSIWVAGFADHRIREEEDFEIHRKYIEGNPVKARLSEFREMYAYSSANGSFEVDAFPQGLKPQDFQLASNGASKAAPFQSQSGSASKSGSAKESGQLNKSGSACKNGSASKNGQRIAVSNFGGMH